MEITLNELSCEPAPPERAIAQTHMSRFIQVVRELAKYGVKRSLRTLRTFMSQHLAPGYLVSQWLNDGSVKADERLFIKTIATKAPYLEDILEALSEEQKRVFKFRFEERDSIGLGVAYLLDCPAAALGCNVKFHQDPAKIQIESLDENNQSEEQTVEVCCLTSVEQVAKRGAWLQAHISRENKINNGTDLWDKRDVVWPDLVFARTVQAQVKSFTGNEQFFRQIIRHLDTLNEAATTWASGSFFPKGVRWSNESESTMKRPDLLQLRQFTFPDGRVWTCSLHTKLIGPNLRIHFAAEKAAQKIYVGYIGPHLPTAGSNQ